MTVLNVNNDIHLYYLLTLQTPIPQNGQTHTQTIRRQFADELFECV